MTTDVADKAITLGSLVSTGNVIVSTLGTIGNVTIDNSDTALGVQGTVSGDLVLTSGDMITDSDVLTVTGTTTVTTDMADKAINLGSLASTGAVSLTTSGTAGNVVIDNGTTALDLGASTISGTLSATSGAEAGIVDSGNIAVSGDVTLTTDANNGVINLGTLQQSGGDLILTTNGTGDATVVNNAAIDFGVSNVGGELSATASAGTITQNGGALTVAGTSSFTAGANAITLSNASNDFTGAVSLSNSGTNDVSLTDVNALDLGTVSVGQNLSLTAVGAISDTGVVTVAGTTTLDNSGGANAAILLNSESTYTGNVTFTTDTGSDVTITDNSDFAIQSGLNVNNLSITSTGSVTDLGDIDIDGTLTVSAADQTIDLSGTGNDLTGGVNLTGAAVTLVDTTATSIAGITATGALSVTSGGTITQTGAIDADLASSFTAGANAITLSNASNDFSGAVSLLSLIHISEPTRP